MAQHSTDKSPLAYPSSLEKGSVLDDYPNRHQPSHCRRRITENMPSARNLILTLVVGLLVTLGLASAVSPNGQPCQNGESNGPGDAEPEESPSAFSRLLSSASPEALHKFLHSHFPGTYRHGVFDSDQAAMEAVHSSDPELASSIVELAKRQSANETIIDSLLPTESTPETPTESSVDEATTTGDEATGDETTVQPTTTAVPTSTDNESTPTETPTEAPTDAPTETPTEPSTEAPTETPTATPTEDPTEAPTTTSTTPTEPPEETTTTEAPTSEPDTTTTTEAPTSEGTIFTAVLAYSRILT